MQCPSCGTNLRDNAVFCSACGTRIAGGGGRGAPTAQTDTRGDEFPRPPPWTTGTIGEHGPASGDSPGGVGVAAPGQPADFGAAVTRLRRLFRLDTSVFAEARADPAALVPALVIVAAAIVVMALGGWLWYYFRTADSIVAAPGRVFIRSVLIGSVLAFALWAAWVWITATVLAQSFRRRTDWVTLARAMGLAAAPLALGLVMVLDVVHFGAGLLAVAAAALLSQIAVQEAAEATAGEAFAANLAGFAVWALALSWLGYRGSDLAPGIFWLGF